MKLVVSEFSDVVKQRSDLFKLLTEFAESEHKCVEVVEYHHKTSASCASAFDKTAKRYKMFNIEVKVRNGRVFLIKKI